MMNMNTKKSPRVLFRQEIREKKARLAYHKGLRKLCFGLVIAAAVTLVLLGLIFGIASVEGRSMYPAIKEDDMVLFSRLGGLSAGDIVILTSNKGEYIKRIAGMPGDIVDIDEHDNIIIRAKTPAERAQKEPEGKELPLLSCSVTYPIELGPGEYFVLGDNQGDSTDSRAYGPVKKDDMRGRVIAVLRTDTVI